MSGASYRPPPPPAGWSFEYWSDGHDVTLDPANLADTDVSKVVVSAWFAAANPGDQPSDSQQALLDQISALLAVQPYLIDSTLAEARKEQGLIVSKPFSSPIDAQNWARGFPKGTSYAIFFDKDSGAWYAEAIVSPP